MRAGFCGSALLGSGEQGALLQDAFPFLPVALAQVTAAAAAGMAAASPPLALRPRPCALNGAGGGVAGCFRTPCQAAVCLRRCLLPPACSPSVLRPLSLRQVKQCVRQELMTTLDRQILKNESPRWAVLLLHYHIDRPATVGGGGRARAPAARNAVWFTSVKRRTAVLGVRG